MRLGGTLKDKHFLTSELLTALVRSDMEQQKRGQSTGPTEVRSGGSSGTPGRAGRDQDDNARVADTSPGDVRSGAQAGEDALGGPGTQQNAAERGSEGLENIPGMRDQVRRWETEAERMTGHRAQGRGAQRSEEAGMWQASMAIRETREEGDPEMQMREEDLHARQQNLGERERALRERDEHLRAREQGLRERQTRVTGRGMGATDYTDDIHIQNRR